MAAFEKGFAGWFATVVIVSRAAAAVAAADIAKLAPFETFVE